MKTPILLSFLLLLHFNSSFANNPASCAVSSLNCDFYLCLEEQKSCGQKGYLLNFGHKYCTTFKNQSSQKMSRKGRHWLYQVSKCLQIETQKSQFKSCSKLRKDSIKSHSDCYFKTGYCDLSDKDQQQVIDVVFNEVWRPLIFSEALQILLYCPRHL